MSRKTEFQIYLEDEVKKVKGVYYPVKAGWWRRTLIKKLSCKKLHPNPDDEFCDPEIGPNYEIISRYRSEYSGLGGAFSSMDFVNGSAAQPLMVEKTAPEGYMILNGHHRWAAAIQTGMERLPVEIVDLTRKSDITRMLEKARSDKRATLDLDEAVFAGEGDPFLEKKPPFPMDRIYTRRLHAGIPALFHFLKRRNYDIWLYTAKSEPADRIFRFFGYYRIPVTGVVNGTGIKAARRADSVREMEKMISEKYRITLHIDSNTVVRTFSSPEDGRFEDHTLSGDPSSWSREVIDTIERMEPYV